MGGGGGKGIVSGGMGEGEGGRKVWEEGKMEIWIWQIDIEVVACDVRATRGWICGRGRDYGA